MNIFDFQKNNLKISDGFLPNVQRFELREFLCSFLKTISQINLKISEFLSENVLLFFFLPKMALVRRRSKHK